MGDQEAAVEGRRTSRRPRINYLELLGGGVLENDNPNELEQPAGSKGRRQWAGGEAAEPARSPGRGKRKAAEQQQGGRPERRQQQEQQEAAAEADAQPEVQAAPQAQAAARDEGGSDTEGAAAAAEDDWQPGAERQRKQKRARVLVDVHRTAAAAGPPDQDEAENEFERARLERIRRNQEVLQQMGIRQMAHDLVTTCNQPAGGAAAGDRRPHKPRERRERAPALPPEPSRKSARMRGMDPSAASSSGEELQQLPADPLDKEQEQSGLLELEDYFALQGKDISGAYVSDGRYHGWVSPAVCERYGVAGSAGEAWEAGGGGKFSFKIDKKAVPAHLRSKGWSDARAFSFTQLQKNPNAYFYRHVVPHEKQAQGEWTEEEHELFLSTARANGVGDKWGLFASHIPQRVGYQCSAYYREVVIPAGLVIDKRFKMTRNGKAVFVG